METKTILLVDDEPDYRLIMRTLLMSDGWNVVLAENGQDALEKVQDGPFDLVITDVYMPVMDGIKFHRQARSMPEFARVPFLFVSAFDDQHTLGAVDDPKLDGFLKKGRPIEDLMSWITYLTLPEDARPDNPPERLARPTLTRPPLRGSNNAPMY